MRIGNHQGRDSDSSTVMPIWVGGYFRLVRIRLINGDAELLLGIDIIRKLRLAVDFGRGRFQVGQGEWEGATFNDKYRWVFPLVPTACAYAKSDDYFRKMQKKQIEVLQTQGDFLETQEVRKVSKSKQNRERNRM